MPVVDALPRSDSVHPRTPRLRRAALALLAAVALLGLAGCEQSNVVSTISASTLRAQIRRTDKPVLVFFYKYACATSVAMEPLVAQLANDYRNELIVVRYMHVWPWLQLNSFAIAREHQVLLCPTMILFSNGKEQKRWFSDYLIFGYTKAIDKVLAQRAAEKKQPPATPSAGPPGQPGQPAQPAPSPTPAPTAPPKPRRL